MLNNVSSGMFRTSKLLQNNELKAVFKRWSNRRIAASSIRTLQGLTGFNLAIM